MLHASSRVLLASLALAIAAPACKREPPPPVVSSPSDNAPVRLTAAVATARQIPVTLALTGTLVPGQQSDVTPLVGGRVTEVLVERGSVVHSGDELIRLRIEAAKKLLDDLSYRVYEVAKQTGFYNTTYFFRVFKKIEGCTPTEYRAKG
jgi:multidrug efflux pump subunit AcrA (membrane-fusion protein)